MRLLVRSVKLVVAAVAAESRPPDHLARPDLMEMMDPMELPVAQETLALMLSRSRTSHHHRAATLLAHLPLLDPLDQLDLVGLLHQLGLLDLLDP